MRCLNRARGAVPAICNGMCNGNSAAKVQRPEGGAGSDTEESEGKETKNLDAHNGTAGGKVNGDDQSLATRIRRSTPRRGRKMVAPLDGTDGNQEETCND